GGGGSGGPVAGLVLVDGGTVSLVASRVVTKDAGSGRFPNRGTGGFNYGLFLGVDGVVERLEEVDFQLGAAGSGAPQAAPTSGD
ncbi:MAG TPA: hypothetical protein RMG48_06755, partial [Myxococcales bacterium LLY-WYZ-16_1]|nr:hypothetical protein [Myxococcales bacterium LLY-WYZ-16_1]